MIISANVTKDAASYSLSTTLTESLVLSACVYGFPDDLIDGI